MLCGKKQGDPPNLENLEYYEVKLGGANDRGVTFTDRTGTTLAQAPSQAIDEMAIEELNQLKAAKKKELVQLKEQLRNVRKEFIAQELDLKKFKEEAES